MSKEDSKQIKHLPQFPVKLRATYSGQRIAVLPVQALTPSRPLGRKQQHPLPVPRLPKNDPAGAVRTAYDLRWRRIRSDTARIKRAASVRESTVPSGGNICHIQKGRSGVSRDSVHSNDDFLFVVRRLSAAPTQPQTLRRTG